MKYRIQYHCIEGGMGSGYGRPREKIATFTTREELFEEMRSYIRNMCAILSVEEITENPTLMDEFKEWYKAQL